MIIHCTDTTITQKGKLLKERGTLKLLIERNLYEDFCRDGMCSKLHVCCVHIIMYM